MTDKALNIAKIAMVGLIVLLVILYFVDAVSIEPLFFLCYTYIAVTVLAAVGFPIAQSAANPKSVVRTLIFIAALAVIFGAGFGLSSAGTVDALAGETLDPAKVRVMSAGLITFYSVALAAVAMTLYAEINRYFK